MSHSNENKITNSPQDEFFIETFSDVEKVRDYFKTFFPKRIYQLLDLENLKQHRISYITDELEDYFSDLVFEVNLKNQSEIFLVTFLFESKSHPIWDIKTQLLHYQLEIWRREIDKEISQTHIIPILFHPGESGWKTKPLVEYFPTQAKALEKIRKGEGKLKSKP